METRIEKLKNVLTIVDFKAGKKELVYLSIVFLGYKIPEVSNYFKLSEIKVQAYLTKCGVRLKRSKKFMAKMHTAARAYNVDENLKIVA